MAFDQSSVPNELRPINIIRNVSDDPRISPATSSGRPVEGYYGNPSPDVASTMTPAVYYQTTVSDAGFIPLGFNNAIPGITGWVQHVVPLQPQPGVVGVPVINSAGGSVSTNLGKKAASSASDHTSDEGSGGSVPGRKVKFLCSFGGKILPRPSDGALRYVGGQTRIISVGRDASFGEFVQKMADIYEENAVIKYQLPEEDLDALVSVSCPDDLENMMDEYEKLVERSPDGSAKLRIFLLSPLELDSSGLAHLGYMQDCGQKYVEAVNGIMDSFTGGVDCLARKESIESTISGQSSDFSGTEGADSSVHGPGDDTGVPPSTVVLSTIGNSGAPMESTRVVCSDQNVMPCTDPSPLSNMAISSGPSTSTGAFSVHGIERPVPVAVAQTPPGVSFPTSSPYVQGYVDPPQGTLNSPNYVQIPSQMGFPPHILGPIFQQPITAAASPQQFTSALHMTINPSYISMKPNAIPAAVQPQHIQVEHYPAESIGSQRFVQLPAEQGHNAWQTQIPATVQGGTYNWTQIPHHEQITFSDGNTPPQQANFPENVTKFEDCFLCQKALPHAHSDTIAQERKVVPASTSNYHSLHLDGRGRAVLRPVVTGTIAESNIEELAIGSQLRVSGNEDHESVKIQTETIGVSQNLEGLYGNDKFMSRKIENPEQSTVTLPQGIMMTTGVQFPYGVFASNTQSYDTTGAQNLVVQPQLQVMQDTKINKTLTNDVADVLPKQNMDFPGCESSNDYSGNVVGLVPVDDSTLSAYDHLRQINRRLENLHVSPSEVSSNNEHSRPIAFPRKDNSPENWPHPIARGEPPSTQNFPASELNDMTELPPAGIQHRYPAFGVNNLHPGDSFSNPIYTGMESTLSQNPEKFVPASGQKDNVGWFQPKIVGDTDAAAHDKSSISPSSRVGDMADNLSLGFTNQDSWNMPDSHLPPPKPSKIQIRRDNDRLRDSVGSNYPVNVGDAASGNYKEAPLQSPVDDGTNQPSNNLNWDFNVDHNMPNKDSAEERIKLELQAVAEGVASSVLMSSLPSNSDQSISGWIVPPNLPSQNGDVESSNMESQQGDTFEEIPTKLPQKINFGFPTSDIGRLQIIKNSDLEELRELGSGTFGTVYHGKWRGTDVAIKRINDRCFAGKPSEQERMRDDFWNEAIKLADLHHPNVVAFYGVVLDGPDGSVATVTEYMVNGSLRNALQKNERNLDKRKRLLIGMDVAFGMEYLHGKNIVHFDLKSDNLLVNLRDQHRPICKVGDLGLSKVKCQTLISGGVRGTLPWMAPELLNGSSSLVSEKVDVFSFGIVMWELLTGEEPYADLHYGAIIGGIVSNTLRPPVPEQCDPDWKTLMERCWASESSERPNFTEIANELRAMAAKLPTKGQAHQQVPSSNPPAKS